MANPIKLSGLGKQANALAKNAKAQLSSSISSIGNSLINSKFNKFTGGDTNSELVFPNTLRSQPNVHTVRFTVYDNSKGKMDIKHIFLPCPANIAINDSATYNTIDLGVAGTALGKSIQDGGFSPSKIAESLKSQAAGATSKFTDAEIAAAATQLLPGADAITGAARLASRTLLNPNTNTTFSGNALRSFTFGFKMVATSPEEAEIIRTIHHRFRRFSYADSRSSDQNIILAMPPTWTIHFLDGSKQENKFIPRIYSCYLVSVESAFNSTTNMFHEDGAPLEVDVSLSYQETRALTRTDIDNLNEESLDENRGIDENGTPKISATSKLNAIVGDANESIDS
jgi:hypothetical protein